MIFRTTVFGNNEAAIKLANYHYTKKAVEDKEIVIKYIDTSLQRADCLTKEQTKPSFAKSVTKLLNANHVLRK